MFIPLHDDAPLRIIRFQLVSGTLIAINLLTLIYTHVIAGTDAEAVIQTSLGIIRP